MGLARNPWLVVMDEPTNHLDLPSVECLEEALAECPAALLLVSHDRRFLDRLTDRIWEIQAEPDSAAGDGVLRRRSSAGSGHARSPPEAEAARVESIGRRGARCLDSRPHPIETGAD